MELIDFEILVLLTATNLAELSLRVIRSGSYMGSDALSTDDI